MIRVAVLGGLFVLLSLGGSGAGAAENPKLVGTVGPGFTITLQNEAGARVTRVEPGTYEITVRDLSEEHNFHLRGPGVNEFTPVETTGTVTWTVTLVQGVYTYVCDPHSTSMRGTLTVGQPPPPPKPPPRLNATVGPGLAISLRNAAGRVVRTLHPGGYRIVVRDRTRAHNFHLVGAGVNRRTGVAYRGTVTWRVNLRAGKLYRFYSDRNRVRVKGSFRTMAH